MGPLLEGIRVLDRTGEIAGPYCSKLLRDAGADVVKVEAGAGDPLRRWRSGTLFEFLNGGKRSVADADADDLVSAADIVLATELPDLEALWAVNPALVVVTITPFGVDGPWAGRPATEFTLQAACGSTGSRGLPESAPLAAGGRVGEWITGTYAAVGAAAALRSAAATGRGRHVDVAMLDCMAVSMVTYPSAFAEFLGWPPLEGTNRSIEVPSIAPTSDGWVVFTTNSGAQFQDFLVQIGRADLLDDPALANATARFGRRDEFLAAVLAYTTVRTTAEVLAESALFRIPAGPVLDGATVPSFEQFVARGVFVDSPTGRFRQPRTPYRIGELTPAPVAEEWTARAAARDGAAVTLPLAGIRILDCTAWWAGPAASHVLACLGADVVKVESPSRPDLMRYSSVKPPTEDRWWEWGPLFHAVNVGKRAITLDLGDPAGVAAFERLLPSADIVLENYTPRVMEQFGLGWDRIHEVNPATIMVRMPAFGLDGPWRDRNGFAQTMESITGMAWLTGEADGSPVLLRGACDPLAGMHAVFATLLALRARDAAGGTGSLVESVMVEAALNAAAEAVLENDATGIVLGREGNRSAAAAPQGVYRGNGPDRWVALAVVDDERWLALRDVLGAPEWAKADELTGTDGRRRHHDLIDGHLATWFAERDPADAVDALTAAGIPAEVVIAGRDIARNPQLRHRGLFEVEDHPLTGCHELPTLPFRLSGVDAWLHRPAPTLGQDNDEILGKVLSPEELDALRERGVVADRVRGS